MHHWCPDCREFLGRQNGRHGRKIFIEIGVCHTNWISIMVVFGLIDLLINQRSGYFEGIRPPWVAQQCRALPYLLRVRFTKRSDRQRCWLREIPRCCTIVNARGISIHSALPAWWEEKSAVVWWFVIATVLIINGSSIIPTFAPATTTPDSYAINLCPLPYLLAPRIRYSLPSPRWHSTLFSTFWHSGLVLRRAWQGEFYDSDFVDDTNNKSHESVEHSEPARKSKARKSSARAARKKIHKKLSYNCCFVVLHCDFH